MNHNTIYQLFASTYHTDPNIRKEAEITVRNYEQQPGFLPMVLQLLATEEVDLNTRQAGAVYLKHRVQKRWNPTREENDTVIHPEDKASIRQMIFQALYTSPRTIQVHLASSLYNMLNADFPSEWPTFIQEVSQYLTANNHLRMIHVGLIALHQVVKVYQYKSIERRDPLEQIIDLTFPTMLMIGQNLIQLNTTEAVEMLTLCLKIYHASIQVELPACLQHFPSSLSPWITLFLQIVDQKLPYSLDLSENISGKAMTQGPPHQLDQLESLWALKKWAYLCLNRLFGKYGNPSLQPPDPSFALSFVELIAPSIVQTYLQQLNDWIQHSPQPEQQQHHHHHHHPTKTIKNQKDCLSLTAAFFDDAIKHRVTWQLLKSHMDALISQFLFRQLCFSDEDEQLWSKPIEYIHKELDEETQDNIINLLVDLANYRKTYTFMHILDIIQNVMNEQTALSENQQHNGYLKDGALRMFGALASVILSDDESDVIEQIEPFFKNHIFPEFTSQFPYLRARACQLIYQFDNFDFTSEENLGIMYQHVLNCLKDDELPVKVAAARALQALVKYEYVQQVMRSPELPLILRDILALTSEADVDLLSTVMQDLVETFPVQLTPFAIELCTQLRDMYLRTIEELLHHHQQLRQLQQNEKEAQVFALQVGDDDEDVFDIGNNQVADVWNTRRTTAATGILKTLCSLVLSINQNTETSSSELLMQLETIVAPAISNTLMCNSPNSNRTDCHDISAVAESGFIELYGDLFDLIDACTFSLKAVTPTMWSIFVDCIYPAFKNEQNHLNMNDIYSALENYLVYGKEVVSSNEQVKSMLFDMIAVTLKTEESATNREPVEAVEESERTCACKLLETILLRYRGDISLERCVVPILTMVFPYITKDQIKSIEFKVHCLEVVISAMYYNPLITLHFLEEHQLTQGFFNVWFTTLHQFSRVHDKKLVIVTLCSLLNLPNENVPGSLQAAWPHILLHIAKVFQTLPEAIDNREQLLKEGNEDAEETEDDEVEADEQELEESAETPEEGATENDEDDDVVEDEDAEYLEFLAQRATHNGNRQEKFTVDSMKNQQQQQQQQQQQEEEELQEDVTYQSPLDDINPYFIFEEAIKGLQQQNPGLYMHITKSLNEEQRNFIMSIINTAEQQRQNGSNE